MTQLCLEKSNDFVFDNLMLKKYITKTTPSDKTDVIGFDG